MKKMIVLTFDDAVTSHRSFVVPLLQEYGFGATFFVCRCTRWIAENPECFLDWQGIREIHDAGFEIGNHTLNHIDLRMHEEDECRREVTELNRALTAHGIPQPKSFAYPGGPYAGCAAQWLGEYGLLCARTTEKTLWTTSTDPMRIGSFSVNAKEEENLHLALSCLAATAEDSCAAVLTYHGVPELAHPWCGTPPEMFRRHMQILRDSGYRVVNMEECRRLKTEGGGFFFNG